MTSQLIIFQAMQLNLCTVECPGARVIGGGGGRTNSPGAFLDLDQVKHPFLPLSKVTMLSSGRALEP